MDTCYGKLSDRINFNICLEIKEMKEREIEDLMSILKLKEGCIINHNKLFFGFLANEKELLSKSIETQKELETLQEIITSMTLQLREKDKQNEELKQSLKSIYNNN